MNKKIGLILCAVAFATGAMAVDTAWNGLGDGATWSDAGNWTNGVPGGNAHVYINPTGATTIDLEGSTSANVLHFYAGIEDDTGPITITNGTLRTKRNIFVATGSNSTAKVYVADYVAALSLGTDIFIGTGEDSDGLLKITADNDNALSRNELGVGTAVNSRGELNAVNKTFSFDDQVRIGSANDSVGIVSVGTFIATNETVHFAVAGGADSQGHLTAANGSIISKRLEVAKGDNSVGIVDLGTGTIEMHDQLQLGVGISSSGTVSAASINKVSGGWMKLADGSNSYAKVAVTGAFINNNDTVLNKGDDSTAILEAGSLSTVDLLVARGLRSAGTVTIVNNADLTGKLAVASDKDSAVGTFTVGDTLTIVGTSINIATGSNSVGSVVANTFNATVGEMSIGGTNAGFNAVGSLTMDNGTLTIDKVLIGDGSTLTLNDGYLTVTNMEMGAGSELIIGEGELLWTDADAVSIMDIWVTSGLVSTNDGFGQAVTSFTDVGLDGEVYGTGDTRLFIDVVGADTKMWAETIPEPATIGMMMLVGGGLLFIRRRTMS